MKKIPIRVNSMHLRTDGSVLLYGTVQSKFATNEDGKILLSLGDAMIEYEEMI